MTRGSRGLPALLLSALALAAVASPSPGAPRAGAGTLAPSAWHPADAATQSRVNGWMDGFASGWTPNLGQIADADGRPAPNVLYSANVRGAQVYVTTTGLSHYFFSRRDREEEEDEGPRPGKREDHAGPVDWSRLDLAIAGAVIRPELARPEDALEGQGGTNFYLPQCPDGVTNVPTWGAVRFPDVYPGIDWVVRSEPGQGVHHDFVVRAGADAAQIRLEYTGATAIEVSEDLQSLRVRTALGEVREGALRCYQGSPSNPVGAKFRVDGNRVSVIVGEYDHSRPLTIDPPLVWSTYYGGSDFDGPRSIWCDNLNGWLYIVGYTNSTNLPVQSAGGGSYYQGTSTGPVDGFIWKFTQAGVRLWATYYGGSSGELTSDCVTDASGNLYVTGSSSSLNFPVQNLAGAYNQPANAGYQDAFLLKFNSAGVRQWATYYGGSGDDYGNGITVDASGKVYLCGITSSANLPLANPGGGAYYQSAIASTQDAFIARFSALGVQEWSTYFGGPGPGFDGDDDAYGITTTAGSVYMTGSSRSAALPTMNPLGGAYFQPARAGDQDLYVARFTLAGVQQWTTYFGGDSTDYGDEPIVDAAGNVFVSGYTTSSNIPTVNPGGGAYYQPANGGDYDLLLLRFNPANSLTWATYLGGSTYEFPQGGFGKPLALDAQGRLYFTAMSMSTDFPVMAAPGFNQGSLGGAGDAVICQFASNCAMLWSTYYGTNVTDFGTSVGVGSGGCLFATGESWQGGSLVTANPLFGAWFQGANAGSDDGFIAKFCSPNSACCHDFNCSLVSSQAECTAMGGTAFYPGQPCSTVTCTILCTICGTKFNDLNRNGVKDGGEPGLPGWTIALYYPNGPLYLTATTGVNGNYCFNNIPCGAWTVSEVQQPGWLTTYPPTGVHSLAMGTGTTQNNVNFGNWACASTAPCATAPPWLSAWWSFNDGAGALTAADHAHGSPARNVAQVVTGGGSAGEPGTLCLTSPSDHARVPVADQLGIDFGSGSFAITAWLSAASSSASPRTIAVKRAALSSSSSDLRGWSLYLNGLQSMLEIGTGSGGAPQVVPGPVVAPDEWSHLAVSVDRDASLGHWYLNGAPAPAYDFVPRAGSVSSTADLTIGQASHATGLEPAFQGCIGDLALFSAPLSADAVYKAWIPGPIGWCPEFATMPSMTTFCGSQATKQVCFTICNNNATAQSYHWSLAGLPAGPGCSVAGPVQFSPAAGTVTIPAGGCSGPICVTVTRPAGLTSQNATACFELTFVNDATGACRTRTGKLRADYGCWCATPAQSSIVTVPARVIPGAVIGIGVGYPCDPVATMAYRLRAVWLDPDHEDPLALSLNGLPPGTPVDGAVTAGPGNDQQIEVSVSYPGGYDPSARYEIVMDADTDNDGQPDQLCGVIVQPGYDSSESVGVPAPVAFERSVKLTTSPNPFRGRSTIGLTLARAEQVELGVYDLGGRMVRSLARGRLEAGPHQFEWNGLDDGGRRAPAGIYFVRLDGSGRHLETKLVKMQ